MGENILQLKYSDFPTEVKQLYACYHFVKLLIFIGFKADVLSMGKTDDSNPG
jgi:hypothetical protein